MTVPVVGERFSAGVRGYMQGAQREDARMESRSVENGSAGDGDSFMPAASGHTHKWGEEQGPSLFWPEQASSSHEPGGAPRAVFSLYARYPSSDRRTQMCALLQLLDARPPAAGQRGAPPAIRHSPPCPPGGRQVSARQCLLRRWSLRSCAALRAQCPSACLSVRAAPWDPVMAASGDRRDTARTRRG